MTWPVRPDSGLYRAAFIMSWKATAWAKETRGHKGHGQKLMLMVLADYHNPELDQAWPSQAALSRDCEMPERTVRYELSKLEAAGFITVLRKGNQYQPTIYKLNFNVYSPIYEPAINEPAIIAAASEPAISSIVNRQYHASEPARVVPILFTNRQEPPIEPSMLIIESNFPEWFKTLSQDPRWHGKDPERYIQAIEKEYHSVNLDLEAHSAYEWLQSPKGQKKKVLRGFWRNWLKNVATIAPGQNGRNPSRSRTTRSEPQTSAAALRDSWYGKPA